jgi:iron-sulfur cluster repair protein YtfE (RIC family)
VLLRIRDRKQGPEEPDERPRDAVDLLLDCHARIRSFHGLAVKLADTASPTPDEITGAAASVIRYFTLALPLHVDDEERSILPRLRGRDPALDQALEAMRAEHRDIESGLAQVVHLCAQLRDAPARHAELRGALSRAAHALDGAWLRHLGAEEALVFPAMRALLDADAMRAILAEMRGRRAGAPAIDP